MSWVWGRRAVMNDGGASDVARDERDCAYTAALAHTASLGYNAFWPTVVPTSVLSSASSPPPSPPSSLLHCLSTYIVAMLPADKRA